MNRRNFTFIVASVASSGCGGRIADDPIAAQPMGGDSAAGGSVATGGNAQTGGLAFATGGVPSQGGTNGTSGSVALAGTAAAGGASSSTCGYDGTTHAVGESFWVSHPCMLCTCYEFGEGLVAAECSSDPCEVCQYEPYLILAGDTVPAGDGCNTCTCIGGGPGVGWAWMPCTSYDCGGN